MEKIKHFIKKEIVFVIAAALAVISSFFVPVSAKYLEYIDFKVIALLFCLMSVIKGFMHTGLFDLMANKILTTFKTPRALALALILMTFFSAMLVTNDVALIAFVPLCIGLYEKTDEKSLIFVVVMQTIAANLGSMLTPIGNPQNLYLYGKSGYSFGGFMLLMLPYAAAAFVLLTLYCGSLGRRGTGGIMGQSGSINVSFTTETSLAGKKKRIVRYIILFVISLLVVVRIVPYPVALAVVVLVLLLFDRQLLAKIDYALLLTFVGFFIFIGNMGRMPAFNQFLAGVIEGNEVITAVVASQVISNVPAALLLSGFTENVRDLIIGTNLGGLGTLIASMASLISYKFIAKNGKCNKGAYFRRFSVWNVIFLAVLMGVWVMTKFCIIK